MVAVLAGSGVERPSLALAWRFLSFLAQASVETAPLPLQDSLLAVFSKEKHSLVREHGEHYHKLASEWVWPRS